jgi:Uma2 family endonuclease
MRANVTRAAEGFDRRSFTVGEILRIQDAGIIAEDENFELIEGEVVPMQAKTHVHELLKSALTMGGVRALPENLWMGVSSSIYLGPNTFVEPDIVVYPKDIKLEDVKGSDILLLIEVATTSLPYDRALKAQLYARYGVREFWVVDGARRTTFIHQGPEGGGWRSIVERGPDQPLSLVALPGFSIRLATV